jgi:hypothetical protein
MRPRYQHRDLTIKALVEHARGDATGLIAVPDIQRPFVWGTREVRSLLASVLAGVPIGGMLFGRGADGGDQTVAGKQVPGQRASDAAAVPNRWRVLDGRQRLTALSIGFQPFIQGGGSPFIQSQPVWFLQLDGVLDDLSVLDSAEDLYHLLEHRHFEKQAKGRGEGTYHLFEKQLKEQSANAEGGRVELSLPLPWLLPFATKKKGAYLDRRDRMQRALLRMRSEAADALLDTLIGRLTQHAVPVTILHERDEEFERQAFARLNSTGIRLSDLDLALAYHGLRADLDSLTAVNRLFEGTPHPQLIKLLFAMHPDRKRLDRLGPEANEEGVASNSREAASANAIEVRCRIGEVDYACKDAARTLLRDLGLCFMEDSPVEEVTHAAIGVMAEMLSTRSKLAQRLDRGIIAARCPEWSRQGSPEGVAYRAAPVPQVAGP